MKFKPWVSPLIAATVLSLLSIGVWIIGEKDRPVFLIMPLFVLLGCGVSALVGIYLGFTQSPYEVTAQSQSSQNKRAEDDS